MKDFMLLIKELSFQHGIEPVWNESSKPYCTFESNVYGQIGKIRTPFIKTDSMFASALHELGHILCYRQDKRINFVEPKYELDKLLWENGKRNEIPTYLCLQVEADAWKKAEEIYEEWNAEMIEMKCMSLFTYVWLYDLKHHSGLVDTDKMKTFVRYDKYYYD